MSVFSKLPNSATTLSLKYRPGQDKRLSASKSEAIFTFGDFSIDKSKEPNNLEDYSNKIHFGSFDSLSTLRGDNINPIEDFFVKQNELNLPKKDPKSYSYFSSFYTNVATSINNIINNFPYAILSKSGTTENVLDYEQQYNDITQEKTCTFKIIKSSLINQGNIAIASANTVNMLSLPYDYDKFCIQISGETGTFKIKNYFLSGTNLHFEIYGYLKNNSSLLNFYDNIYIRPTKERLFNYRQNISLLEKQLIGDGLFNIPNNETISDDYIETEYVWPKSLDGFAPDSYGSSFDEYKEKILLASQKVDDEKTDIFLKTIIPENYLDYDSNNNIYRVITQTYANEFDKIKNYIDAMSYSHSINYNNEESVPSKFMSKLSQLLGWELSNSFNEVDIFDYLISENEIETESNSYFNTEIWRRILVNLNWLYKKKGTRDAIMFIFKMMGAPDSLIKFDEFKYKIEKQAEELTNKVDIDGYINYNQSEYAFQEGGGGRGDGDSYINQWKPEFDPFAVVDNKKIWVGDDIIGTREIINSKEVNIGFYPSQAIEEDVWEFFKKDCSCWTWGSSCPPFSSLTVPYEYLTYDCDTVKPSNISGMTLAEYVDYIYTNSIDPRTRKTNHQSHTVFGYPELKNIYLSYFYSTYPENYHLTVGKLESYLQMLEFQMGNYVLQLMPSTTIFENGIATVYKNPVFHRERFVYKEGVCRGSMFKRELAKNIEPSINMAKITLVKNEITKANIDQFEIRTRVDKEIKSDINMLEIITDVNIGLKTNINAFNIFESSMGTSSEKITRQKELTF